MGVIVYTGAGGGILCKLVSAFQRIRVLFFLMWTIFKVFIEFVTILLLFFYVSLFGPGGMRDLSSATRDGTCTACLGR